MNPVHLQRRLIALSISVMMCGCASTPNANIGKRARPPRGLNLEQIFLSLPDHMVADMPILGRTIFLQNEARNIDPTSKRFDPQHRFIHYHVDSDERTGATSMLYLKVLSTSNGSYIVFVYMPKPLAEIRAPSDNDLYILRPGDSGWVDVTSELLPEAIQRKWYFNPRRKSSLVEVGRYIEKPRQDGRGLYWGPIREFDLLWNGIHFEIKASLEKKFTYAD